MLGGSFQKRLAFVVTGLAACVPITRMCAQTSSSSSEEDTRQFCARVTTQPLTPPSFAHPVSEAELRNCDSAALYYGFDRPPDAGAALQCAYYQRAHPDPSRGDPFAGPGVLTMLYANGKGVSRNYDLALLFACETWGAPLETDARVVHLQDLRRTHAVISNFDLCDGMTSGLMQGACGSVRERFADGKRGKELRSSRATGLPRSKKHLSRYRMQKRTSKTLASRTKSTSQVPVAPPFLLGNEASFVISSSST